MKRLVLTQCTVRCPLETRTASLTVRTNPGARPSRRHLDVVACSLLTSPPVVPPARTGYFSDVAPPVAYLREPDPTPRHAGKVACPKRCLAILNAAEPGAARSPQCTSGVSDGLELARQTQSPAIMRALWLHSA